MFTMTEIHTPRRQLIIIGGAARSGTTLIRNLFAGHEGMQTVPTEWVGFNKLDLVARQTSLRTPKTAEQMEQLLEAALAKTQMSSWDIDPELAKRNAKAFAPGWDAFFLTLIETLHNKDSRKPIVLKAPWSEKQFFRLRSLLEDSNWDVRFIYAIRHPIDVYLSHRHRAHAWEQKNLTHTDTLAWCCRWLESLQCALDFRQFYPELLRVVEFETVVNGPGKECSAWCDWIGVPDKAPEMLSLRDKEVYSSHDISQVDARKGGVLDLVSRPRPDCSEAEVDLIRLCCAGRAATFGYDLGEPKSPEVYPPFLQQHMWLSQLSAAEYSKFLMRDAARRLKRIVFTIYSRLTRVITTIQLR